MARRKAIKLQQPPLQTEERQEHRNRIKAITPGQAELIRAIQDNELVLCDGPAGSGKTMVSIGVAVDYLVAGKFKKIIITRPTIECGNELGFLPGNQDEKLYNYLIPAFDCLSKFLSKSEIAEAKNSGKLETAPLQFMRGRTFDDTIVIADEMQNSSFDQMKMLITRLGKNCKIVVSGDIMQSDLKSREYGALEDFMKWLSDLAGIGIVHLKDTDIVRNPLIGKILKRIEEFDD